MKAVFLDRDGVLDDLAYNPDTGEYESPYSCNDLEIHEEVFDSLRRLLGNGYELVLVSNQPGYVKGKASLQALQEVGNQLRSQLADQGVDLLSTHQCFQFT